ncbi:hypothetical protein CR513_44302, partial [Mucuna pruriens]
MTICFGVCHIDMYDIIENGSYIPHKEDETILPRSSWNEDQKMKCLLNSKARNFIMHSLIEVEYEKIHSYKSFKEMIMILLIRCLYTSKTMINNMRSLGKTYDNYDHITKILQSLPR